MLPTRVVSEYDVGFLGMGHLFERYERVSSAGVYIIRSTSRTIQITLYPY